MKKIISWIGVVLFTIASVLMLIFVIEDLILSVGVMLYYLVCLIMLIGVNFRFKPYEWLLFSIGMFAISAILALKLHLCWCIVPLFVVFVIMIIIRYYKKQNYQRIILMLIVEILCGFIVTAIGLVYKDIKIIENIEYEQKVVKAVHRTTKDFDLIEFEGTNQAYTINKQQINLLRQGDTVYVKIYNGGAFHSKRY